MDHEPPTPDERSSWKHEPQYDRRYNQQYNERDPRAIRLKVQRLYHEADRVIEEAISPEKLKENPYKGKPLRLEENPYDRGFGMAHRMLKNTGHTLPWIDTKKEIIEERRAVDRAIDDHIEWLKRGVARIDRAAPKEKERVKKSVREGHLRFLDYLQDRVVKLRKAIERFNLEAPLIDQQVPNVRPETFVAFVEERAGALLQRLEV